SSRRTARGLVLRMAATSSSVSIWSAISEALCEPTALADLRTPHCADPALPTQLAYVARVNAELDVVRANHGPLGLGSTRLNRGPVRSRARAFKSRQSHHLGSISDRMKAGCCAPAPHFLEFH